MSITRTGDSEGQTTGEISLISVSRIETESGIRVITAVRDSDGNLKLISWHVPVAGDITRTGDSEGQPTGEISLVDIVTTVPIANRVVTAVRDSDGNLKLISWGVSPVQAKKV